MIAQVRRLDAVIQAAVDWVAFGLMRRGVPKSFQTYVLAAFFVAGVVSSSLMRWQRVGVSVPTVIGYTLVIAMLLFFMHRGVRIDRVAEQRGTLGTGDMPLPSVWKVLWVFLTVGTWAKDPAVEAAMLTLANVASFIECYLRRTPRQPPATKVEAPTSSNLVTAS